MTEAIELTNSLTKGATMVNQKSTVTLKVDLDPEDVRKGERTAREQGKSLKEMLRAYTHELANETVLPDGTVVCRTIDQSRRFLDRLIDEETGVARSRS